MIDTQRSIYKEVKTPILVHRALIALEMGATDKSILTYLNYFVPLASVQELSFLHVLPEVDFWDETAEEKSDQVALNERSVELLQKFKERTWRILETGRNIKNDFGLRQGSPLQELLAEAHELNADLVVTGQSTQRGSHGILAKALARHAPCNTLVIPDLATPALSQCLVPVDFSNNSAQALKWAVNLNNNLTLPARITCLHVYNGVGTGRKAVSENIAFERKRRRALVDFLKDVLPDHHEGIELMLVPAEGRRVGNIIHEISDEIGADLIVIGAKGHTQIERLLLGSVTESVLSKTTRVPVMVVR